MLTCACGAKYWPSQKWIHEGCAVSHQEADAVNTVVVNGVVNRKADRHDKEARREYMREYMRKKRAG